MKRAQRLPQAKRREQLIAVATRVFAESGYRTASMDDVADAAGVSKPVLYQHFDSKQSLYLAVIDVAAETFGTLLLPVIDEARDNFTRVERTFTAYFSFVTDHEAEFLLLFHSDAYEAQAQSAISAVSDRLVAQITRVFVDQSAVTEAEAALLGQSVAGMAQAAAMQFVGNPELDAASTARLMAHLLWRGVSGFPNSPEDAERFGGSTRPWELE